MHKSCDSLYMVSHMPARMCQSQTEASALHNTLHAAMQWSSPMITLFTTVIFNCRGPIHKEWISLMREAWWEPMRCCKFIYCSDLYDASSLKMAQ
jgi:hypothetical protein